MPGLFHRSKGKKKKKFSLLKILGGALIALLLLFLVMDNFVLYWFMLFNNDQTMERRRQSGSEWYGGFASGEFGSEGSGGFAGAGSGYGNYGNTGFVSRSELEAMTPEEAVAVVSRNLSEEEKANFESAMRMFIYILDRRGFVPNATIGAMSFMMAESGSMGLYSYESHYIKSNPGPDGNVNSKYLDNQAWVDWLNGPGRTWARDSSSTYRNKGTYSIGLGLVQSSDTWNRSSGEKTLFNATYLLESAISKGLYWQEPGFQIPYYMEKYFVQDGPFGAAAWDVNHSPGVDPTKDANVTAYEWAVRVYCGVGYPALVYTEAVHYTSGDYHDQIITHTAGIDAAREMYEKYSKKDPWFYTEQTTGSADWHNPFVGQVWDNSTPVGRQIARMGVLLAALDRADSNQILWDKHGTDAPNLQDPRLAYYKAANIASGQTWYFASCDRASSLAVLLAGADDTFPRALVSEQRKYCNNSDKWTYLGKVKDVQLQPGDIMMGTGHIQMYVGTNIAGERWPGTTARTFQASLEEYYPDMSSGVVSSYDVWRCTKPDNSSKYWDAFISSYGAQFPELPRTYQVPSNNPPVEQRPANNSGAGATTIEVAELPFSTVGWIYPLDPSITHISSHPGSRTHPAGYAENHKGTDIPATEGSKIYAARNGTVVEAGWNEYGRGYWYRIESDDGETCCIYQHMSGGSQYLPLLLKKGDHVVAGQHIGYVGNTGDSYGAHLHFEIASMPYNYNTSEYYSVVDVYTNMTFN